MNNEFTRQTEADTIFDGAIIAYEQKKYAKALILFNKLLSEYRENIDEWNLRQWLGMCYLEQENFDRAIENLSIAEREVDCKESGDCYFRIADDLGYAYQNVEDYSNAIVYYEKAEKFLHFHLSKEATTSRYLFFLRKGRTYLQLGKHELALTEFNRCKTLLETDEDATPLDWSTTNYEIAYTFHGSRDYLRAIEFLDKIDLNEIDESSLCNIHFIKGASLYHLSRYKESLESFVKAKKLVDDASMEISINEFLEDLNTKL
ncbi:MAG: tetratricopeptide repeat protein [candidate division Zixibacteria bacterium]|nr:tetratricopeptide repeat protein [candidate division Zixibacteria bacterium]